MLCLIIIFYLASLLICTKIYLRKKVPFQNDFVLSHLYSHHVIRSDSEKENNRISNIPLSCTYDLELVRDFTNRIKTNNQVKKEHVVCSLLYVRNSERRKGRGKWLVKCQHKTPLVFFPRTIMPPILSNVECLLHVYYFSYSTIS